MTVSSNDGRADHLFGTAIPSIKLPATDGQTVDLSAGGLTVVYVYPRTSSSDGATIEGWDAIPGARGCTPQSCAFRDHFAELQKLGVERVFGLSVQQTDYQREAVKRLHLPFPLLSDSALKMAQALDLPLFEVGSMKLLTRLTMVIERGRIVHVFYPVSLPERSASDVVGWLRNRC